MRHWCSIIRGMLVWRAMFLRQNCRASCQGVTSATAASSCRTASSLVNRPHLIDVCVAYGVGAARRERGESRRRRRRGARPAGRLSGPVSVLTNDLAVSPSLISRASKATSNGERAPFIMNRRRGTGAQELADWRLYSRAQAIELERRRALRARR